MAYFIPANLPDGQHEVATPATTSPRTPAVHQSASKARPIRVVSMSDGSHGKQVVCEFPDGWQRSIDLPAAHDAWHPLFDDLPPVERIRLRTHADHPVVRHPDGTRTRQGSLPFITEEISARGAWTGDRYFDVPDEDYNAGGITGYRCAGELLAALQRGYGQHIHLNNILEAVMTAKGEGSRKASRHGAAAAFLEIVKESMLFMARHAKHAELVAGRIAQAEKYQAYCTERDAQDKAAFVERMKQAKTKKRMAKEVVA